MPTTRAQRIASNKFGSRITQRGLKQEVSKDSGSGSKKAPLNPYVLYFLAFVLLGSTVFGLIQTLTGGPVV